MSEESVETETERERERQTDRQTKTERQRERQRQRERDRERERERLCCLTSTDASRPIRDGESVEIMLQPLYRAKVSNVVFYGRSTSTVI